MARRDFNVKLFAKWQAQELGDSVKFWNVATWFSKSCRLWLGSRICGKWCLKRRKPGLCSGITNLAVLAAQKRFLIEFGVVVDWTFSLTSNLHNNAGCVWKGKSPSRLSVHRSYRTKFERLVLVQKIKTNSLTVEHVTLDCAQNSANFFDVWRSRIPTVQEKLAKRVAVTFFQNFKTKPLFCARAAHASRHKR